MRSRHCSLIDRPNRSAYAFAFGARSWVRTTRMPASPNRCRTSRPHFRSRSQMSTWWPTKIPSSAAVARQTTHCMNSSFGYGVDPRMCTRREARSAPSAAPWGRSRGGHITDRPERRRPRNGTLRASEGACRRHSWTGVQAVCHRHAEGEMRRSTRYGAPILCASETCRTCRSCLECLVRTTDAPTAC